jgi:hypothetical protein
VVEVASEFSGGETLVENSSIGLAAGARVEAVTDCPTRERPSAGTRALGGYPLTL